MTPMTTQYKRAISDPLPPAYFARQADAVDPTFNWCERCRLPSHGTICSSCEPPVEPIPASWAAYTPDMSCYSHSPRPKAAPDVDCRLMLDLLRQRVPEVTGDAVLYRFSGSLSPAAQDVLATYMERIRANYHEQPEAIWYGYSGGDIFLTVHLPHRPGGISMISLWDYGVPTPKAPPTRAGVSANWGAPVVQMGGVV